MDTSGGELKEQKEKNDWKNFLSIIMGLPSVYASVKLILKYGVYCVCLCVLDTGSFYDALVADFGAFRVCKERDICSTIPKCNGLQKVVKTCVAQFLAAE